MTKPGIIYGNVLSGTAGFILASRWHINFVLLISTLLGMSLVIASACVFNNVIDRNIDKNMDRTKRRALVTGRISAPQALIFATGLGILGFFILIVEVNWLVVGLGLIGFLDYVVLYSWGKRHSVHGTLLGTISGSMPITAGFVAVTDKLSFEALLLFLVMVFWQMAHFYAIATYRLEDYRAAGLPVLPVKRGEIVTRHYIMVYMVAFTIGVILLSALGYTDRTFLIVMGFAGVAWLVIGLRGFWANNMQLWAKQTFLCSLVILLLLSTMLVVSPLAP
jgi:protoheme IX farnesyltransferase